MAKPLPVGEQKINWAEALADNANDPRWDTKDRSLNEAAIQAVVNEYKKGLIFIGPSRDEVHEFAEEHVPTVILSDAEADEIVLRLTPKNASKPGGLMHRILKAQGSR